MLRLMENEAEKRTVKGRTILLCITLALLTAPAAFGQTGGSLNVAGTNPESYSITNVSGGAVSATLALGMLIPATGASLRHSTSAVRLRSNAAYKLTAEASLATFGGPGLASGGQPMSLSDIGFGVIAVDASGANVTAGHSDSIVSGYDVRTGWPTDGNGLNPSFTKTLNDIAAPTQILSGSRISAKGNLSTSNNFALVTLGVAALPQFFASNSSFSTTITLTIGAQ